MPDDSGIVAVSVYPSALTTVTVAPVKGCCVTLSVTVTPMAALASKVHAIAGGSEPDEQAVSTEASASARPKANPNPAKVITVVNSLVAFDII